MDRVRRYSKSLVILLFIMTFLLFLMEPSSSYVNVYLVMIGNILFTGFIPLIVAAVIAQSYLKSDLSSALFMSCGMMFFGISSVVTGILKLYPISDNVTVTTYNLCALVSASLVLIASTFEPPRLKRQPSVKNRKVILASSTLGVCLLVAAIAYGAYRGWLHPFVIGQEFTDIRNVAVWISIIFFYGSSIAFWKQYQRSNQEYHFWCYLFLTLLSIGLFGVCVASNIWCPISWIGRISQYIACLYALLSIRSIWTRASEKGVPPSQVVPDFFIDTEAGYRDLMETSPNPIINIAGNNGIFFVNTAAKRLFLYPESDLLQESIFDKLMLEPWASRLRNQFVRFQSSGRSHLTETDIEIQMKDRNGRVFPAEVFWSARRLASGYTATYIIRDITSRKQQEAQLEQQTIELQKKNRLITDFFTNISHEFKTPLTIILNAIELTQRRLGSAQFDGKDRIGKSLVIMRQNSHRLLRLVSNLLDVTRVDAGFLQINRHEVNLSQWVQSLILSVEEFAAQKGIRVEYTDVSTVQTLHMDCEKLDRILLNLLSNAIKHTSAGGLLQVSLSNTAEHILLCVSDTGEGIPEEMREVIFDRFQQVNTSMTRTSEGSGIGLALTKSLVELLGGKIWLESKLGEGSHFFVQLPIVRQADNHRPLIDGLALKSKVEMEFSDIL